MNVWGRLGAGPGQCPSVMTGKPDSGLHLVNGPIGKVDRRGAVTSLVRFGFLERRAGRAKVLQRRVHMRLRSGGSACDEPGGKNDNHEKGGDDESSGHDFSSFSFARIGRGRAFRAYGFRYPIGP